MGRRRWRRNGVRAVGPRRGWEGEGGGEGGSVAPPPAAAAVAVLRVPGPMADDGEPPIPVCIDAVTPTTPTTTTGA